MKTRLQLAFLVLLALIVAVVSGCALVYKTGLSGSPTSSQAEIEINASYSEPEAVAAYLQKYQQLPGNFISKAAALELGWVSHKGNLWDVTDQLSIGGDKFGNREGLLPKAPGRQYYECDVNYQGGLRGPERLVYSNDGLIFYTKDHYETFVQIN